MSCTQKLLDSEMEVLGEAFDLLEKLGVKGLEKPPKKVDRGESKAEED